MIEPDKIRELVELMKEHGLSEMDLRDGDVRIALKRNEASGAVTASPAPAPVPASGAAATPAPVETTPAASSEPAEDEGLVPINSPMVGTLYNKPEPDSDPFVAVGDMVDEDSTVCIIEAMKVFNEIKAEVRGTVERILVENEAPVEYGQPLMLVRPAS